LRCDAWSYRVLAKATNTCADDELTAAGPLAEKPNAAENVR